MSFYFVGCDFLYSCLEFGCIPDDDDDEKKIMIIKQGPFSLSLFSIKHCHFDVHFTQLSLYDSLKYEY